MKALSINTNEVVNNTVMFATKSNTDMHTSLAKGIQLETMQKRMMRGEVVRFVFMKKNGETRTAVGTLQEQAVKANIVGTGIPKRYYGMFVYLDLEKMAWRGFKTENFVGCID